MDELTQCALAYKNLLDKQYIIILARKEILTKFVLTFDKYHFYHLMGLGKLRDIPILIKSADKVFDDILNEKTTYETISTSAFFKENKEKKQAGIEERFKPFLHIEEFLDSNEIVFKYNQKDNPYPYSNIKAEFLLQNIFEEKAVYIFIDKNTNNNDRFCRSFFPKSWLDFSTNQTKMSLRYKEKINMSTHEHVIQFDKISPKKST